MVAPRYEAEIERNAQGVAMRVVLTLVRRGRARNRPPGPQSAERELVEFRAIGSALTRGARRAVRTSPGWANSTAPQIDTRVFGWIQATNLTNAASRFSSTRISVGDISGNRVQDIMQQLQESNEELTLFTSEWAFVFDLTTLRQGGASRVTIPWWVKKPSERFWKSHEYQGMELNCAAYSIAYRLVKRGDKYPHLVLKKAYDLMMQMHWSSYVTPHQMRVFVDIYKDYRLCILSPHQDWHEHTTFDGVDFTTANKNKIIYLFHDWNQQHFAGLTGPTVAFSERRVKMKFCDECLTAHFYEKGFFPLIQPVVVPIESHHRNG